MAAFASGETQVLVATTVVEVGVDVPNATVMVIEHAERFGLAQLHQLRGRVGRGGHGGTCVLLTNGRLSAVAQERLDVLVRSEDGFAIAEKDLEIRGPGEFFGTRQSGLPAFRAAKLLRDRELLEKARPRPLPGSTASRPGICGLACSRPSWSKAAGSGASGSHAWDDTHHRGQRQGPATQAPKGFGTRPTGARVKQTLFDILAPRLPGCRFLDAFAGSGGIGLEALSRGASRVVMVDSSGAAVTAIKDNLERLGNRRGKARSSARMPGSPWPPWPTPASGST